MKNLKRNAIFAFAGAVTMVAMAAAPAYAASNYNVAGDWNCTGSLVQYGTYRSHSTGTGAQLKVDHMWWVGSQEGRWGLRNTSNTQVTASLSFYASGTPGTKTFKNNSGGTAIAGTSLAVNSRLVGGSDCVPNPTWDGVLTQ